MADKAEPSGINPLRGKPDNLTPARPPLYPNEFEHAVNNDGTVNLKLFRDDPQKALSEMGFVLDPESTTPVMVEQIPKEDLLIFIDNAEQHVSGLTKKGAEVEAGDPNLHAIRDAVNGFANLIAQYVKRNVPFPPEAIKKVRAFYKSKNPHVQALERGNIAKLIVLDERNPKEEQLGVRKQVKDEVLEELTKPPSLVNTWIAERRITAYTLACGKEATRDLMYKLLETTSEVPKNIYQLFANPLDFETMRAYMRDFIKTHPDRKPQFDELTKSLGLDLGEEVFADLGDVYKAASFEGYGPYNELQEKDIAVLTSRLEKGKRYVDVGCGEGRTLVALRKKGLAVEGLDINPAYEEVIKKEDPNAPFHVGSMTKLPFEDTTLDGIYTIGRSLTHAKDLINMVGIFQQFRRVLKDGGKVVFDLPDISTGEYRDYSMQRSNTLLKLGIWNVEGGSIHDSPNGLHFFDRYVPSKSQMEAIAILAGFDARVIEKADYTGATGKKAVNTYWEATKRPTDLIPKDEVVLHVLPYLRPDELKRLGIPYRLKYHLPVGGKTLLLEDY